MREIEVQDYQSMHYEGIGEDENLLLELEDINQIECRDEEMDHKVSNDHRLDIFEREADEPNEQPEMEDIVFPREVANLAEFTEAQIVLE